MNPTKLLITVVGSAFVLSSTLHAENVAGKAAGYELKNRSAFRIDLDSRVPFWPIGYKKPKPVASKGAEGGEIVEPKVQLDAGQFRVTSILLGNPALATINGRSFEEGELLPVVYGGERLRVSVRAIRDGGVWLDHDGKVLFLPLARPELGQKRAAQVTSRPSEFTIDIAPKGK